MNALVLRGFQQKTPVNGFVFLLFAPAQRRAFHKTPSPFQKNSPHCL
jgi:hypothetical protein